MTNEKTVKAEDIDLTNLNTTELAKLQKLADSLFYKKQQEEADSVKLKVLGSDVVDKFRKKIKELSAEYDKIPKKTTITINVPIKFDLDFEFVNFDNFEDFLISEYGYYHNQFEVERLMYDYKFSAKIVDKDSTLDKMQKPYFVDGLANMADDACEECLNLFPEARKQLRDFVKKIDAAFKPIREKINKDSGVTLETILGVK